jgi:hypothetical protein
VTSSYSLTLYHTAEGGAYPPTLSSKACSWERPEVKKLNNFAILRVMSCEQIPLKGLSHEMDFNNVDEN